MLFKRCLFDILNLFRPQKSSRNQIISILPETSPKGKVLLSYIIDGFFFDSETQIPKTHTNIWQTVKMAEIFLEFGYEVEVIHYTNTSFVPSGNYTFFLDVRHNMQRLSPYINHECIKIMHLDTANILFHNAAESARLLQLQQRRGATLRPRRFELPNLGLEHADFGTTTGNDFVVSSFKHANKKIFKLPSPCGIDFDFPERDWEKARKQFLWFSSTGAVHKGLDLALEAFKEMPDQQLFVCTSLKWDHDFVQAYHHELHETPNIHTIGWVDIDGSQFKEIIRKCGSILHFSCSEGGAPSIKVCMHAGLIPVISYESGVDVDDFGFLLRECTIDNIIKTIRHIASLSESELQQKSLKTWQYANQNYTRKKFETEFRKIIQKIITEHDL